MGMDLGRAIAMTWGRTIFRALNRALLPVTAWPRAASGPAVPVVLQSGMLECAHACLAMLVQAHGRRASLEEIRTRYNPSTRGTSVSHTLSMARELGFDARILRAEPAHLPQVRLPCILHWDLVHFVVLESCTGNSYTVVDPASGRVRVDAGELSRRFTGVVIEATPGLHFRQPAERPRSGAMTMLVDAFREHAKPLCFAALLALLLETLGLAAPLLIQTVTDNVLPHDDARLLLILAVAFGACALLQAGIAFWRSSVLVRLSEHLTVKWNAAVCDRLLRLPYGFFMSRSIGDIHSRFGSISEIQRTVTHRFVAGVLDGVTALLSLVAITIYSPVLAAITLTATGVYALLRTLTLTRLVNGQERAIKLQASQQGLLLELLHGVHSIKAHGFEGTKLARYIRRTRDAAAADMNLQMSSALVDEAGQAILRLHWVAAVAMGAYLAVQGLITGGMLVAYVTYVQQFSNRSTRLVELFAEWRVVRLHSTRLADIVEAPIDTVGGTSIGEPGNDDVTVEDVSFRYHADGPEILSGLRLNVRSGECVAIRGPSGSGKSTLAKIVIGLLKPDNGRVVIGGVPLDEMCPRLLRQRIACVLQEDQLFNGTIAENIAFFQPAFSQEAVEAAARRAQIHDEIVSMPLGYESRVIDLGASLSGGQRQRLILARALFRDPRILILDEASSHLDLENERRVNDAISALQITRIIIAHRPETLAIADRVMDLRELGTPRSESSSRADPRKLAELSV